MVSTLQWLGIVPPFSRPRVSDDDQLWCRLSKLGST
jgi:hypothetical protein